MVVTVTQGKHLPPSNCQGVKRRTLASPWSVWQVVRPDSEAAPGLLMLSSLFAPFAGPLCGHFSSLPDYDKDFLRAT